MGPVTSFPSSYRATLDLSGLFWLVPGYFFLTPIPQTPACHKITHLWVGESVVELSSSLCTSCRFRSFLGPPLHLVEGVCCGVRLLALEGERAPTARAEVGVGGASTPAALA